MSFPQKAAAATLSVKVVANQLVNGQGQAVHLIGVDVVANAPCRIVPPSTSQAAAAIASWHANAVRITLNEDCWLNINNISTAAGTSYQQAISNFVNILHGYGLYAILDLHNASAGTQQSTINNIMADADHGPTFWQSVAMTFKNDPAVIFDLVNEPHITSSDTANPWQCWRDGCLIDGSWQAAGMQSLLTAVRSTGATNVIMLGGLRFANDLSGWMQYKPTDPLNQLSASFHMYGQSDTKNEGCDTNCWNSTIAQIAQQFPVITGEIGDKDCPITTSTPNPYITQYMTWADQHNISYLAWWWQAQSPYTCRDPLSLITDWSGKTSSYGQIIQNHFLSVHPVGSSTQQASPLPTAGNSRITNIPTESTQTLPSPPAGCYYTYQQPTKFFIRIWTFIVQVLCKLGFHSLCPQPILMCPQQSSAPIPPFIPSITSTPTPNKQSYILPACQQLGGYCSARIVNGQLCATGRHVTSQATCPLNFHCCILDSQ